MPEDNSYDPKDFFYTAVLLNPFSSPKRDDRFWMVSFSPEGKIIGDEFEPFSAPTLILKENEVAIMEQFGDGDSVKLLVAARYEVVHPITKRFRFLEGVEFFRKRATKNIYRRGLIRKVLEEIFREYLESIEPEQKK